MRKIFKKVTAILLAAAMLLTPIIVSAEETTGHLETTRQLAAARAAELMEALSISGLTIALVDVDNDFTWLHPLGYADAANQIPVTEQTLFNIGSTAKLFTAVALMQLVEAGVLDLDEPITTYLPEFSVLPNPVHGGDYRNITARMLLTHVSGIHELHYGGAFPFDGKDRDFMNRFLPILANMHMQNEEINRITYNNTAYAVLSVLVARLIGSENYFEGFENNAQENIFIPAGMVSSSFDVNDSNRPNIALAHLDANTPLGVYQYVSASGVGGMVSNAHDMAQFMHIMLSGGGDILQPATIEAMRQPQDFGIIFPNDIPNTPMGLGIMHVIHGDGVATTGHGGNLLHHTEFLLDFDNGIGVFVSGNSMTAAGAATPLANFILRAAVEEKTGTPMPATSSINLVPLTDAERIAGLYAGMAFGTTVEIILDDEGALHISGIPGAPALPLTQAANGSFEGVGNNLWFQEIDGIVFMHIGAQPTAPILVGERIVLEPVPASFERWVGDYHFILPGGEITGTTTVGVNENGFAYTISGGLTAFMNQVDDYTFHYPGRVREFGSVVRFSMEGDTAVMRYSTHRLERTGAPSTQEPANHLRFVIGSTEFTHNGTPHQMESALFFDSEYNRAMIPLSVVADIFGAEVDWVEGTQTATVVLDGIYLAVSAVEALPGSFGLAHYVDGNVYIPLRYIAHAFGVQVRWDGANQAVYVYV
ncbi:MAG: serine hydrolase [Defluviitaleaceae bacterium]|nr:serine hydrolase [Defluviitaleaceae bacterium]